MAEGIWYNTDLEEVQILEYGRNLQDIVNNIAQHEDRYERNRLCESVVELMILLNPKIKEEENYLQKLWDHLHVISDFKLDIDGPFEAPTKETLSQKPQKVPYKDVRIKYRFYGRNLQKMVDFACQMEDGEKKETFVNHIASFMANSSRAWNEEALETETLLDHISKLSNGQLKINPDNLNLFYDKRKPIPKNIRNNNRQKRKKRR